MRVVRSRSLSREVSRRVPGSREAGVVSTRPSGGRVQRRASIVVDVDEAQPLDALEVTAVPGGQGKAVAQADSGLHAVGEADQATSSLTAYLASLDADEVDLLLGLEGILDEEEEQEMRARIDAARAVWRAS